MTQGFQGYGFHLSTIHSEIIREVFGFFRVVVLLFLRIGPPLRVYFEQYPCNPLMTVQHGGMQTGIAPAQSPDSSALDSRKTVLHS